MLKKRDALGHAPRRLRCDKNRNLHHPRVRGRDGAVQPSQGDGWKGLFNLIEAGDFRAIRRATPDNGNGLSDRTPDGL
jgi:hypothetical protein